MSTAEPAAPRTPAQQAEIDRRAERYMRRLRAKGYACPGDMCCDEAGLCFLIDVSPRTVCTWRKTGEGPPATKGGRWLYDLEDVAVWWLQRQAPRKKKHYAEPRKSTQADAAAAIEPRPRAPEND